MIKNKKATAKGSISEYYSVYAPMEDWLEAHHASLIKDWGDINWNFVDTVSEKTPTFYNTHKSLENAIRKLQQNDQK